MKGRSPVKKPIRVVQEETITELGQWQRAGRDLRDL